MSALLAACVVLASLAAGVLALAAWLWATRRQTSIPGPPTLPLLGNATMFYKLPVLVDRLGELHRSYGDIFRFYVGPKLVIVITQPSDVQTLMATSKPRERDPHVSYLLSTFLGNGILVSRGEVWKKHRKLIEPAFHMEELEKFMSTFNEAGTFFCEKLAESNGSETEVSVLLGITLLRSISASIFCTKLELVVPDLQNQAKIAAVIVDFDKSVANMMYRPWKTLTPFQWMTAEGRVLMEFNYLTKYFLQKGISIANENLYKINTSGRSLLSYLRPEKSLGLGVTEKEIFDEIVTLITAGVGTTYDTLGYTMTLLGLYPEWQKRAQQEMDDVFGNGDDYLRPTTTADLAQLKVLDAIVKETLRLFSTVPGMLYEVTEDTPLAGGRYMAPRGSTVLLAYCLMHRHPQLFEEPLKFDPGRFMEGGSAATKTPYSYLPFGVGPHKCVGARFAVLQIKAVMAMVLRRYYILPGSSRNDLEESVLSITSHPLTGFRVTCLPRDNIAVSSL